MKCNLKVFSRERCSLNHQHLIAEEWRTCFCTTCTSTGLREPLQSALTEVFMEGKVPLQTLSQEWTTAPDDRTQTQLEETSSRCRVERCQWAPLKPASAAAAAAAGKHAQHLKQCTVQRRILTTSPTMCAFTCLFLQQQIQTVSFSPAQFPVLKRGFKRFQLSSSGTPAGQFWFEFLAFLFHLQNVVLSFSHTVPSASSCGANDVKFSSWNLFQSVLLIPHTLRHHHRKKVLKRDHFDPEILNTQIKLKASVLIGYSTHVFLINRYVHNYWKIINLKLNHLKSNQFNILELKGS